MQSRRNSFREALSNTVIGYVVYVIAQFFIYPLVGIQTTFYQNMKISAYMTVISLVKYYAIRRYSNNQEEKNAKENDQA